MELELSQGYSCVIDQDDFGKINRYKWHINRKTSGIYAVRTQRYGPRSEDKSRKVYLHREIVKAKPGDYVDHINGNTLDNRKSNLRICTNQQNSCNHSGQPKQRKYSQYKGVKKNANCRTWSARITVAETAIYLGSFSSELEAAKAYNKAAIEYHGAFARVNDLNPG